MLKHCVFLSLRSADEMATVEKAMQLLKGLVDKVDGMTGVSWGPNLDFENKSGAYQFGFIVTFRDRAAHLEYEKHPDHAEAGALLISACRGGYEGIFVVDLETE
ncbi:MAG: Dabb family protein [Roseibium sp.]